MSDYDLDHIASRISREVISQGNYPLPRKWRKYQREFLQIVADTRAALKDYRDLLKEIKKDAPPDVVRRIEADLDLIKEERKRWYDRHDHIYLWENYYDQE